MPVRGKDSLMFATGLDNSGLQAGASGAVGIIQRMGRAIAAINPFAALGGLAVAIFAQISTSAYKMAREFETAMKEVETISEATRDNFEELSNAVFSLSKVNPETPVNLAKAYYQIVSAGYDGAAGLNLLSVAAEAALAGVTTTEIAADGLTTTMNAFKIEASRATEVADAMFKTVELGKTTFDQLAVNMSTAAPLAAALGVNFKEVLAMVASLTKQGVPTSVAFTQIRAALIAVNDELGDGWAEAYTLGEAFQEMSDRANGSTAALKEMVGRIEGVNAILATTGENAESAAADVRALEDSLGSVGRASAIQLNSTDQQWKLFSNNIKNATKDLGDFWNGFSQNIARGLNSFFDATEKVNTELENEQRQLIILQAELRDVNTSEERRVEIFEELRNLYPNLLGNLDAETTGFEDLAAALQSVNDQLILKYQLRDEASKQAEAAAGAARVERRITTETAELRYQMTIAMQEAEKAGAKLNKDLLKSKDPLEAYELLLASLERQNTGLRDIDTKKIVTSADEAAAALRKSREALHAWNLSLEQATSAKNEITAKILIETGDPRAILTKGIEDQLKAITEDASLNLLKILKESQFEDVVKQATAELTRRRDRPKATSEEQLDEERKLIADGLQNAENLYANYENAVKTLGREAADERYKDLMGELRTYDDYLRDRFAKTKSYYEQELIIAKAAKREIRLTDEPVGRITGIDDPVISKELREALVIPIQFETVDSEIEALENKLKVLREEYEKPPNERRKKALIQQDIDATEEKLRIAEGFVIQEDSLYEWLNNNIELRRRKAILNYIKYWKERAKIVEGATESEIQAAEEAQDNVDAGKRALAQNTADSIRQISSALSDAASLFRKFGNEDVAQLLDQLSGVGEGIAQIAMGDPLSIIQGSIKVLSSALTIEIESDTAKFEKNIEGLTRAIDKLNLVLDEAYGTDKIRQRKELIDEELKANEQRLLAIEAELKARKKVKFLGIGLGSKGEGSGTDPKKIEELEDAYDEAAKRVRELRREIEALYTGTTTDNLTDTILNAFEEGKKGAADFADTFEELMKKAVLESLRLNFLEDAVQQFYDDFAAAAESGGTLTAEEIARLEQQFNTLVNQGTERMGWLNNILERAGVSAIGIDATQRQGLRGEITTITEDTANVLAGTLNKIMLDVMAGTEAAQQTVLFLSAINLNTGTLIELMEVNNLRLQNIEKNLT